jgi:hypothetical protein
LRFAIATVVNCHIYFRRNTMTIKQYAAVTAALLCLLALCFVSCLNPTVEDPSDQLSAGAVVDVDGEDNDGEEDEDGPVTLKSFVVDAVSGLPETDADVNAVGKSVATLAMPEKDGPWTPALIEGVDDNHLFEIVTAGAEGEAKYEIRIKDAELPLGPYRVSVNIRNEAGTVFHRIITFSVSRTPPPFKYAPKVYSYITGVGKNKLKVSWDELPRGASGYKLYIGTTNNSAEASPCGDPIATTTPKNEITITDTNTVITFADTDEYRNVPGQLPDGTTYYIWLKPYNAEGDGAFGKPAKRTTSATLPEIFWKNIAPYNDSMHDEEDFYCWDSFYGAGGVQPSGDFYRILPPSEEHPGGYLIYGPPGGSGIPSLSGNIVYASGGIKAGTGGKGKWGEPLNGFAGNLIIKYEQPIGKWTEDNYTRPDGSPGQRWYMCVNYYGLGTVQTVGPPVNTLGPYGDARGRVLCYFGNCYDLVYKRNPETDTFEQAIAKFVDGDKTLGSGKYIAGVATPWYRDYWTDRTAPPWANQ